MCKSICDRCGAITRGTLHAQNVLLCPRCRQVFDKEIQEAKARSKIGKVNAFFLARRHYRESKANGGSYLLKDIPVLVVNAIVARAEKTGLAQRDIILTALVEYLGLRGEKVK